MLHPDFPYPIYLVISEENCLHFSFTEVAEQALKAGVKIVQLREKKCSTIQYVKKAQQLKKITDAYDAKLIINDSVEVAVAVNAWGIHLGQSDTKPQVVVNTKNAPQCVGWSIENEQQLLMSELKYVNYLGVSPVFYTPTKIDTKTEWRLDGLKKLRTLTDLPLIAIGGINIANVCDVISAGANSIAVVSAICASKNPYLSTIELKNKIDDFF